MPSLGNYVNCIWVIQVDESILAVDPACKHEVWVDECWLKFWVLFEFPLLQFFSVDLVVDEYFVELTYQLGLRTILVQLANEHRCLFVEALFVVEDAHLESALPHSE